VELPKNSLVFSISVAVACLLFQLAGWEQVLRYDRAAILQGAVWRLVTGNLVHLGAAHLAVNAAGLILIGIVFLRWAKIGEWLLAALASALAVGAGMLAFDPGIELYVGMSGMLHGLFAAGALLDARLPRAMRAVLLAGLAVKLGYEQFVGALSVSGALMGATVAVNAHLYGALGGAAMAGALAMWRTRRR
jgi:rhomboid family GlyGly-CTERM serine protease